MPPNDDIRNDDSTYNELRNEDKQLLLANGYKPGELPPEEERELIRDLREQQDGADEGESADSFDGTTSGGV